MNEYSLTLICLIGAVFFVAGCIKGIVGVGFPTVVLSLLTTLIGIQAAMSLVVIPSLLTNVYQASVGGEAKALTKQFGVLFVFATLFVFIGCWLALQVNTDFTSLLLGGIVTLYGLSGLLKLSVTFPNKRPPLTQAWVGMINGVVTGLTGTFAVPGVFYLQSKHLDKNALVQAMGILFTLSSAALLVGLAITNSLTLSVSALSFFALLPAIFGMYIGTIVRQRLSHHHFVALLYCSFIVLGVYIVLTHIVRL